MRRSSTSSVLAVLVLSLPGQTQEAVSDPIGPSPPPNRFDPEHDARLADAWGIIGGSEARSPRQRPALRPREWTARPGSSPALRREALERHVLGREPLRGDGLLRIRLDGETDLPAFAIAEASLTVRADDVRFVRASGVDTIFVNGDGFVGDPEQRGALGVPVHLRAGENLIQLVGFDGGPLEVELWDPVSELVIGSWDPRLDRNDVLTVPIFNPSAKAVDEIHFHYGRAQRGRAEVPGVREWNDGGVLPPLGMIPKVAYLLDLEDLRDENYAAIRQPGSLAPVCAYIGSAERPHRQLIATALAAREREPSEAPVAELEFVDYFLVESIDEPSLQHATLAVARHAAQTIWYRTGRILRVVPEHWVATDAGAWLRSKRAVRFGALSGGGPSRLSITRVEAPAPEGTPKLFDPNPAVPMTLEVRATDATAMRLVYLVDPFFTDLGTPATFHVP